MWKECRQRAPPDLLFSPFHYQQPHRCALCTARCNFGTGDSSGINSEEGPRMQIERQHEYVPDGQEPKRPIIPVECADTQQQSLTAAKCIISSCALLLQTWQFISPYTFKHPIAGRGNKWHLSPQDIISLTASTQGCLFFFNTKQKHLKPWCAAMRTSEPRAQHIWQFPSFAHFANSCPLMLCDTSPPH